MPEPPPPDSVAAPGISRPYAYYALALLTVTNLVNYLERNAIFALFEPIKRDLSLTDAHLGWLGSAYVLVFSLASVPAGIAGDLGSRRVVIAAGVILWSVATSLSGLVEGFGSLLFARAVIGLGGAAAATAGASLVADHFPGRRRSVAMGLFMAGLAVGGVLGILVAGQLAHHYGWRVAFFTLGLPGFLIAALVVRLKDPTRPTPPSRQGPDALFATMRELEGTARRILATPTLVVVFVGGALISFGMNGLVGWAPTFLARERGLSIAQSTLLLGSYGLIAGTAGTVAGGFVADALRVRWQSGRLLASGLGFIIGVPLAIWLLFIRDMTWFVPVFSAAFFFLTWYNGPLTAVIFDVTPSRIATTVVGAFLMFIHLAGDAIAFPLVGALSDSFGLQRAILLLPVASLAGALIVLLAVRWIGADTIRAQAA
ncbi:MAG TPA: MFS transporter [Gemmatimonadales bacterium]|nr:MFS transporter [Gemmatimonadales bacterium]